MPPASSLRWSLPASAAATLLVLAGCTGSGGSGDGGEEATPRLADVRPGLAVAREAFCDALADDAVEAAVGEVEETGHYGNGERAQVVEGERRDVAHEFGCSFTGTTGAVARAWVFVPQVTRKRALELVREVRGNKGCDKVDAQGFGKPSAASLCREGQGLVASWRGLFGDAWFSCSLRTDTREVERKDAVERAGAWCAAAVQAAAS